MSFITMNDMQIAKYISQSLLKKILLMFKSKQNAFHKPFITILLW